MSLPLLSTLHYHYVPVAAPAQCPALTDHMADPAVHEAALCLGYVPTKADFARLLAEGTIEIWHVVPHDGKTPVALAIDSHLFGDHELAVYPQGAWTTPLAAEVLAALAASVFMHDDAALWVYTALALPLPEDAETSLAEMGWDVVPSDTNRGYKKTFGLERAVHRIYTEPS